MKKSYCHKLIYIFLICFPTVCFGQSKPNFNTKYIEQLIDIDSLSKAENLIGQAISHNKFEKRTDSLVKFILLSASLKLNNNSHKKSIQKAQRLTDYIENTGELLATKNALQELAWLHSNYGNAQEAYKILQKALRYAKKIKDPKMAAIHDIEYSLGFNASGMGNFQLSKTHYFNSLQLQKTNDPKNYVSFQILYNALGGIMWYESKLDSSAHYFKKSLTELAKTDKEDILNQYYRPSLVKMNLSILMNALGRNHDAIQYVEESIKGYEKYIQNATDEGRILQAKKHRLVAIENLASFYNTIGEQKKSLNLIEYSLREKKKILEDDDINIAISNIILAEAKMANLDYSGAMEQVNKALTILENKSEQNLYWHAAAIITKGNVAELMEDIDTAKIYYQMGEKTYRKAMAGSYAKDYMDNLIEISLFYAKNNHSEEAENLAMEIYRATKNSDFKNTLQDILSTINLAEIYFLIKDYEKAIQYSEEALNIKLDNPLNNITDSVLFQYRKPRALLINAKAKYHTLNTDKAVLEKLLAQVDKGLAILDQRKQTIATNDDISLLIAENTQLFDFAKKLRLALYSLTQNKDYLDSIISIHEAGVYNKIRSRLNLRENITYGNIPISITDREQKLRNKMSVSLISDKNSLNAFFDANNQWENYLDSLQNRYPDYYKMKFARIETSLDGLQENIPANSTIIRYLFIDDNLYAVVLSQNSKEIVPLNYQPVKSHINQILNHSFDSKKISPLLFELYQKIWQPIDVLIQTPKVIIIPDRELFNLCFEMLTPSPIKSYKELATNSLLAKYIISYNYSLHILNSDRNVLDYTSDYVAFAPVFSSEMKNEYKISITDSSTIDKSYLTLLPQPFSEKLIREFSKTFDGTHFMNENASKEIFIKNAGDHKIIHIATHAESDNISPELSRLIFAKKISDTTYINANSLYTYEIYNINLASDLAILTACETGKPTHRPGEGMISLAHAFNYAGSKSILTSLWNIDEVSSSQIVSLFYHNLKEGMDKDQALQQAKLTYISTHEDRTVSPEYWAGLILIGDTSPIEIGSTNIFKILLLIAITLLLLYLIYRFRLRSKNI